MPAKGDGKWARLLASDADLQRWHRNLGRGSKATADNYLRILGRFLEVNGLTPAELVSMDAKARDDALDDFVSDLLAQGRTGSTCAVYKKAVASWLSFHGESLQRRLKIPDQHIAPRAAGWNIPDQEALRRLLNVAKARERVIIGFMAYSGVRPQVLGTYHAEDGLRLEHLEGVSVVEGELHFEETPVAVHVPRELSKTGRAYITFLGDEGCDYLASYVHARKLAGEEIGLDSPVVTHGTPNGRYLRAQRIGDILRVLMRRVGIQEPPYILRSYFDTRLMHAEGQGMTRDMRQFMMGHAGDMEHKYTFHKKLPRDTLQRLREGYVAALPYLETRTNSGPERDPYVDTARVVLQMNGFTDEELDDLDLEHMTRDELIGVLREHGTPAPKQAEPSQRVVRLDDLDAMLGQGWRFKHELSDGRVLVENS